MHLFDLGKKLQVKVHLKGSNNAFKSWKTLSTFVVETIFILFHYHLIIRYSFMLIRFDDKKFKAFTIIWVVKEKCGYFAYLGRHSLLPGTQCHFCYNKLPFC